MRTYTRQQVASQSSVCRTVDNYFNYSYDIACERYESVALWYENEREFDAAKKDYLRKKSA